METTTKYPDEIVSAGQLLRMLDSDAKEISTLCQKACLKPKKDGFGNIYFSKSDVDVLRKVKELYAYTKKIQEEKMNPNPIKKDKREIKFKGLKKQKEQKIEQPQIEIEDEAETYTERSLPVQHEEIKPIQITGNTAAFVRKIDSMENNIITKMGDMLAEKLDGLDEVIVELIKAKTENESLRQKINTLNKENFALKTENSSYKSIGLGFYVKKSTDDFTV